MPKLNPDRPVLHERHLARRIREEREARGWTVEKLAQAMTEAGCPLTRASVHRIEHGDPPRRITVDEAVTFANVFGRGVGAMLNPVDKETAKLFERHQALTQRMLKDRAEQTRIEKQLVGLAEDGYEDVVVQEIQRTSAIAANDWLDSLRFAHGSKEWDRVAGRWLRGELDGED